MALRFPYRCKDASSTAGALDYTLLESTAAGYRNLTRAVVDGDLADGDTVPYMAIDPSVVGGPKLMEVGVGQWNNTTKVLTRAVIYQPAATGIISWGAGTRDIFVIDNPALFLLLAGGTMSGALYILLSGSVITPATGCGLLVQRSSSGHSASISIVSAVDGVSRLNLGDGSDEDIGGVVYDNVANKMTFRTNNTDRASIDNAGLLKSAAGRLYTDFAVGSVTKAPFYMSAAPTGWTRITSVDGCAMRLSDAFGGTATTGGGRTDIAGPTISSEALDTVVVQSGTGVTVLSDISNPHNHTVLPKYADFLIASLD